ncbi:MAG: DNA-directed RNA polymerase subunit A' [Candidatus Hadarchaeales archaeon]
MPVTKMIDRIEFGLMSPEEIRKISKVRIVTPDTYDEDGFPIDGGLMDLGLGVVEPSLKCKTCGGRPKECPGHFGHIELARPVIHIGYVEHIYNILRAICRNRECSRILLSEGEIEEYRTKILEEKRRGGRWWEISDAAMKKAMGRTECPHCKTKQREIIFEKPYSFLEVVEEPKGKKERNILTPIEIRDRLEKIRNEDLLLLGMDPDVVRPEWMILTVLPVPPVTVRPTITLESGARSEDDLTHKLVDIIRINQRLAENLESGAPNLIIDDLWDLLQYHVATYLDNAVSGVPPARHRSGRVLRTLAQRLRGKEGRFRGNLSGKRVDFSARTVVSPDPNISINEIGVPIEIAKILTVPVKVTELNIEEMRELVRRGPDVHPGANYVITPNGVKYTLKVADREMWANSLAPGYIVERHLRDGDIVLFNRQPSLHRMSIMAHVVKVLPGRTFRLNLSVCPPYNADFDGDEMNVHVPQSEEAQAEARILMKVQEHILSPRFGGPIIGGIQEHITGAYLLTRKETKLTKKQAQWLLAQAGIFKELPKPAYTEKGVKYWSGKQIFSMLLPPDLNLTYRAKICRGCSRCKEDECDIDAYVVIRNGKLEKGVIDAKSFKALERCVLLDRIAKEYGVEAAREFIDRVTRLSIAAAMMFGFTTGSDDEDIPERAKEEIKGVLKQARKEVEKLVEIYLRGELEPLPGRSLRETLEMEIMRVLAEGRDEAGRIAEKHLGMTNFAVIMAKTGARGSMLNLTQMSACVGQQSVRGERISRGYKGRTLPHFKPGDLRADARGFVTSSYKSGLKPVEFFFHAMGGREGLVDTAVRTAQSGYLQRRLINALQDLRVEYDGTVRDDKARIIQFRYGEDSANPAKVDAGKCVNVERIIAKVLGD